MKSRKSNRLKNHKILNKIAISRWNQNKHNNNCNSHINNKFKSNSHYKNNKEKKIMNQK